MTSIRTLASLLLVMLTLTLGSPLEHAHTQTTNASLNISLRVPISADNIEEARTRLLKQAQQKALTQYLATIIAPEWTALLEKTLQLQIISHHSRYITAWNIDRLNISSNRTQLSATVSVQLHIPTLINALRVLWIPLRQDAKLPTILYYASSDPVLGDAQQRVPLEQMLIKRLALLNYQVTFIQPLSDDEAKQVETNIQNNQRWPALKPLNTPTANRVWIRFVQKSTASPFQANLQFFAQQDNTRLANITTGKAAFEKKEEDEIFTNAELVLNSLVAQLIPSSIRQTSHSTKKRQILVELQGLTLIEDEEEFFRGAFGRGKLLDQFTLAELHQNALLFKGPATRWSVRRVRSLVGKRQGNFLIERAVFSSHKVMLQVARFQDTLPPKPTPISLKNLPRPVQKTISIWLNRFNNLVVGEPELGEEENNGWFSRANQLKLSKTLYGKVDSRKDSDFFVVSNNNSPLYLYWNRMGSTQLSPIIRIYAADKTLIETLQPGIELNYSVPKQHKKVYIEISDRFGYIEGELGGYRQFHYLLLVTAGRAVQ